MIISANLLHFLDLWSHLKIKGNEAQLDDEDDDDNDDDGGGSNNNNDNSI